MSDSTEHILIRKSLNAIGSAITRLSYEKQGQLSAITLGIPLDVDKNLIKMQLRGRLAEAGIDFVHINFSPSESELCLLQTHFHAA